MALQKSSKLTAVGRWMMLGGLALATVGGVLWAVEFARVRGLQRAEALVSSVETRVGTDGQGIVYVPHFRFRGADGAVTEAAGTGTANPEGWAIGEAVAVAYRGGNPRAVRVASAWALYRSAIVCAVVGILGFDLGAVVWWIGRRRVMGVGGRPGSGKQRRQIEALFGRAGGYRPSDPR